MTFQRCAQSCQRSAWTAFRTESRAHSAGRARSPLTTASASLPSAASSVTASAQGKSRRKAPTVGAFPRSTAPAAAPSK